VPWTRIDPNDPFALTLVLKRRSVKFSSGECALERVADEALVPLAKFVLPRVCKAVKDGLVQTISLEGHTDNRAFFPASPACGVERSSSCSPDSHDAACILRGFENNVRLSGARAEEVFFHVDSLVHAQVADPSSAADIAELSRCLEDHFTIAGRGPVEPVGAGSWRDPQDEAARDANRRVVIKLRALAKPPTLDPSPR
jgi:flagellar motor protein MotB